MKSLIKDGHYVIDMHDLFEYIRMISCHRAEVNNNFIDIIKTYFENHNKNWLVTLDQKQSNLDAVSKDRHERFERSIKNGIANSN